MSKHSKDRTMERYNLELSYSDEKKIIRLLNEGKGTYLNMETDDPTRKFVYLLYKNIPLKLLYAEDLNGKVTEIVTAYPFDVEEYNEVSAHEFNSYIKEAVKFLRKNGYIVFKKGSLKRSYKK